MYNVSNSFIDTFNEVFIRKVNIPYSQKIWWRIKFGGLVVQNKTANIITVNNNCNYYVILQNGSHCGQGLPRSSKRS